VTHNDMIQQIKDFKGPIIGTLLTAHDTIFVQVKKGDLLAVLGKAPEAEHAPFRLEVDNGELFLHPSH
jgi:hypothetical protein